MHERFARSDRLHNGAIHDDSPNRRDLSFTAFTRTGWRTPWASRSSTRRWSPRSKQALTERGVELVEHDVVVASKEEARAALKKMKDDDASTAWSSSPARGSGRPTWSPRCATSP